MGIPQHLAPILDDGDDKQAEKFVLKLQHLLILETKKAAVQG
jgi:hypothetical protein